MIKNVAVYCKNLTELLFLQSHCKNSGIPFISSNLSSLNYSEGITVGLTERPRYVSGYDPDWYWHNYGVLPTVTLPEFIGQSINNNSLFIEDEDFLLL